MYLETVDPQHRGKNPLTDVMNIAFDGTENNGGQFILLSFFRHGCFQHFYRRNHGFRSDDQAGKEYLAVLEPFPHFPNTDGKSVIDQIHRIHTGIEGLPGQIQRSGFIAVNNGLSRFLIPFCFIVHAI